MEPIRPDHIRAAMLRNPEARAEDFEEYERLLAARFQRDPRMPKAPEAEAADQAREARLAALYQKLFRETEGTGR